MGSGPAEGVNNLAGPELHDVLYQVSNPGPVCLFALQGVVFVCVV